MENKSIPLVSKPLQWIIAIMLFSISFLFDIAIGAPLFSVFPLLIITLLGFDLVIKYKQAGKGEMKFSWKGILFYIIISAVWVIFSIARRTFFVVPILYSLFIIFLFNRNRKIKA